MDGARHALPREARPERAPARLSAAALLLFAALWAANGAAVASAGTRSAALDSLLRRHVRAERVDYLTLRDEDGARLDAVLKAMAAVDAAALPADQRLAHEIDLYNATMLRAVCDRYREGWTAASDDFAVFKSPLVRTLGGAVSLDHLEHQVIRPRARDPRVHAALVCGARSCPPIAARAWGSGGLEAQLEARMRAFVRDSTRNRVDRAARTLKLSRIFEWFAEDFGGPSEVPRAVSRWSGQDTDGFAVSFLEYDWGLNLIAPRTGLWRTVSAERAGVSVRSDGTSSGRSLVRGEVVREREVRGSRVRITLPGGGEGWVDRAALRPWRTPS